MKVSERKHRDVQKSEDKNELFERATQINHKRVQEINTKKREQRELREKLFKTSHEGSKSKDAPFASLR